MICLFEDWPTVGLKVGPKNDASKQAKEKTKKHFGLGKGVALLMPSPKQISCKCATSSHIISPDLQSLSKIGFLN